MMRRLLLILLIVKMNCSFSQTDTSVNISNYSNYHLISLDNYLLFTSLLDASSSELKTKYREVILRHLDSNNLKSCTSDIQVLEKIRRKVVKKRHLAKRQKEDLFQFLFAVLSLKDSFHYSERSSMESDYFFDTCANISQVIASEKFTKSAIRSRRYGFFSFVKFPPIVELITVKKSMNFDTMTYRLDGINNSPQYNNEINLRLRSVLKCLNQKYILVKVNRQI